MCSSTDVVFVQIEHFLFHSLLLLMLQDYDFPVPHESLQDSIVVGFDQDWSTAMYYIKFQGSSRLLPSQIGPHSVSCLLLHFHVLLWNVFSRPICCIMYISMRLHHMLHQTMSVICVHVTCLCQWALAPDPIVHLLLSIHDVSHLCGVEAFFYRPNNQVRQGRPCIRKHHFVPAMSFSEKTSASHKASKQRLGAEQAKHTAASWTCAHCLTPKQEVLLSAQRSIYHKASTQHTRAEH